MKLYGGLYDAFSLHLLYTVHEITASHWSLSDKISCVTGMIRFLPVTMTGIGFSNLNIVHHIQKTNMNYCK